jgi:hypothetical protein
MQVDVFGLAYMQLPVVWTGIGKAPPSKSGLPLSPFWGISTPQIATIPRHLILSKWAHIPNWDWVSTATMPLVGILGSASGVRRFGVSI